MNTYTEAMKQLQHNKRTKCEHIVRWNAGDGFIGEGQWCNWRKRIVTWVVSPTGTTII